MDWKELLSDERERDSQTQPDGFRNPFDMDYERVIGSSSLRRLQDKTQVFPLQANDFIRTRLTHSMEVSSLGRSIGRRIARRLEKEKPSDGYPKNFADQLSALLAVAGLVHDLGNPPFGHYGETIIRDWANKNASSLFGDDKCLEDYSYFDGNAQTIRILTRLQNISDDKGMNFAFGTLAALLKYPWSTDYCRKHQKEKLGYFFSEQGLMEKVISATGMKQENGKFCKNPVTLLLEAADDIAYLFADLEDGYKKGCFSLEEVNQKLIPLAETIQNAWSINEWLDKIKRYTEKMDIQEQGISQMNAIRIYFQGRYIEQICDEFLKNYNDIMDGSYEKELVNCNSLSQITTSVKEICRDHIFNSHEVLMLELTGKKVLFSLLDTFAKALCGAYEKQRLSAGKLYGIISNNFKHAYTMAETKGFSEGYRKLQLVIDFISGMSDSYALNLHRSLIGVILPSSGFSL